MLNLSIPHFECLVRDEYLYDLDPAHVGQFTPARVFGVRSHPNRAMGFHVILASGAQFAQLPIEALCDHPGALPLDTNKAQLWDCFGVKVTCTVFEMLQEATAQVWLASDTSALEPYQGTYLMTFDWWDNGWSDQPDQHKTAHLFCLEAGQFALQPNNRIYPWNFPSFTTASPKADFTDAPKYKAQKTVWLCEDREPIQGDSFFYTEAGAPSPVLDIEPEEIWEGLKVHADRMVATSSAAHDPVAEAKMDEELRQHFMRKEERSTHDREDPSGCD